MAIRSLEVIKRDFNPGDTHQGYLLSKSINELPKEDGTGVSQRPCLVLVDEQTREKFKIFLGSTCMDIFPLLVEKQFTICKKSKEKQKTSGSKGYYQYDIRQDDEKILTEE